MTLFVQDVPDELHRRFKALAAARGESIKAAIIRIMADACSEAGRFPGATAPLDFKAKTTKAGEPFIGRSGKGGPRK